MQTDASEIAIGATLSQSVSDGEHPICYLSRKLLDRETRYAMIEKECLAVVWALSRVRYYLYGRHFEVVTDPNPLAWLNSVRGSNHRLERWALSLQEYSFTIRARTGKLNANADALSRL